MCMYCLFFLDFGLMLELILVFQNSSKYCKICDHCFLTCNGLGKNIDSNKNFLFFNQIHFKNISQAKKIYKINEIY